MNNSACYRISLGRGNGTFTERCVDKLYFSLGVRIYDRNLNLPRNETRPPAGALRLAARLGKRVGCRWRSGENKVTRRKYEVSQGWNLMPARQLMIYKILIITTLYKWIHSMSSKGNIMTNKSGTSKSGCSHCVCDDRVWLSNGCAGSRSGAAKFPAARTKFL